MFDRLGRVVLRAGRVAGAVIVVLAIPLLALPSLNLGFDTIKSTDRPRAHQDGQNSERTPDPVVLDGRIAHRCEQTAVGATNPTPGTAVRSISFAGSLTGVSSRPKGNAAGD